MRLNRTNKRLSKTSSMQAKDDIKDRMQRSNGWTMRRDFLKEPKKRCRETYMKMEGCG